MGDSAGGNLCAVLSQRALRGGWERMIKCQVLLYPVIHCIDMLSPSYQYYYSHYRGAALLHPTMLVRWLLMYVGVKEINADSINAVLNNSHSKHLAEKDDEIRTILGHSLLPATVLNAHTVHSSLEKGGAEVGRMKFRQAQSTKMEQSPRAGHLEAESEVSTKLRPLLTNPDLCPILGRNLEGLAAAMICTVGIDILRDEGILYARRLQGYGVPVKWNHYEAAFHGILHMPRSKQRKQLLDDIATYLQETL